jgi:hypothetical protein
MILQIELTSHLLKRKASGKIEFQGYTIKEALVAFGLNIEEVGFVTRDKMRCVLDEPAIDGATYKVYPTIIAG